ncbi:hypothetical protein C0993_007533, partial [Termitomyces sp. T159_Od127]
MKFSQDPAEQNEDIATIINQFLRDHNMICAVYPSLWTTNEELESLMQKRIEEPHGLSIGQANKIMPLHLGASMAEERFLRNLPQLDPILDGLASCLLAVFDLYPTLFATLIVGSIFDYMVATCSEPLINAQSQSSSTLFPSFLRRQTGAGSAYALMIFSNSLQPVNYTACFHALADMNFWVAGTNDILSYYKESVAGETANYMSVRADAEAKKPLEVASDLEKELVHSRNYIYKTLSNAAEEKAVRLWRTWERGY